MFWEQKVEYAALSDIGFRRRNNQDSYAVQISPSREQWSDRGHLFLVADGMGGHAVGELASKLAADIIPHTFLKLRDQSADEALKAAVLAGNATINARGEMNRDFTRMGTTCTTLVLNPQGALIAHVGDSRAYRIRGDRIEQLTFDHSLQWELLRQGKMSPEEIFRREPRNVITRSLGPSASVQVDVEGPYPTRPHDIYVLCSDGLSSLVRDEEIGIAVRELPAAEACRLLVDIANLRGGPDNITVVVVRVGEIPPELPQEGPPPEVASAADSHLSWIWPITLFLAGVAFIAGHLLTRFERPIAGVLVQALGIVGVGGLLFASVRLRRLAGDRSALSRIAPGTPYRTSSAKITPTFVNELANVEYNLQRSAIEEGWSIDWNRHSHVFQLAKDALAEKRYPDALRDYAKAIHVLMGGIHLLRKQRDQMLRWGVRPPASQEAAEPNGK
ncbi:MAG TPA: protein phosphatase 2C domain-containing protein [Planctomycetaceae bacterium]|jgi:protein phosphatase|nr:protein phosphatase 2C domain-containing protein [Planctomycetaceae bacterium]